MDRGASGMDFGRPSEIDLPYQAQRLVQAESATLRALAKRPLSDHCEPSLCLQERQYRSDSENEGGQS